MLTESRLRRRSARRPRKQRGRRSMLARRGGERLRWDLPRARARRRSRSRVTYLDVFRLVSFPSGSIMSINAVHLICVQTCEIFNNGFQSRIPTYTDIHKLHLKQHFYEYNASLQCVIKARLCCAAYQNSFEIPI